MSKRRLVLALVAAAGVAAGLVGTPLTASAAGGVNPASTASAARVAGPAVQANPTSLSFPDTYAEEDSAPQTVTLTSTGTTDLVISGPITFDEDDPDTAASFRITASTCDGATLAPGAQCTVTVVAHPETVGQAGGWLNVVSNAPYLQVTMFVTSLDTTTGLYYPVAPHRILDTRTGVGAGQHPVAGGATLSLPVLGQAGVPPAGVSAVVLNLTVTHPTTAGHITAFPSGTTRPLVSAINYAKGWTGANLTTVPVGADGKVNLFNSAGSVDLVADVDGWYAATKTVDAAYGTGSGYAVKEVAVRVLDTRHVHGAHLPLGANQTIEVAVPAAAATKAAAITLTAVKPQASGYLTAGAVGADLTKISTLNLRAGVTTPNLAIVPTQPCSQSSCGGPSGGKVVFRIYNGSSRAVDVLVDLQGSYAPGVPYRFQPLSPTRILDTRAAIGPIPPATTRQFTVPGPLVDYRAEALVANVTAVNPSQNTVITVWAPGVGVQRPNVSTLNPVAGSTVASGALLPLYGPQLDEKVYAIYNSSGYTSILIDVSGRFDYFLPDDPII